MKITDLKLNEENPRYISKERMEKLTQSIKDFPRMMSIRPIITDNDNVILGGNMRYRALIELGYTELEEAWVRKEGDLTPDEKRQFIIKDNISFGAWDMDILANEWNDEELEDWGLQAEFPKLAEEEEEEKEALPKSIICPHCKKEINLIEVK